MPKLPTGSTRTLLVCGLLIAIAAAVAWLVLGTPDRQIRAALAAITGSVEPATSDSESISFHRTGLRAPYCTPEQVALGDWLEQTRTTPVWNQEQVARLIAVMTRPLPPEVLNPEWLNAPGTPESVPIQIDWIIPGVVAQMVTNRLFRDRTLTPAFISSLESAILARLDSPDPTAVHDAVSNIGLSGMIDRAEIRKLLRDRLPTLPPDAAALAQRMLPLADKGVYARPQK